MHHIGGKQLDLILSLRVIYKLYNSQQFAVRDLTCSKVRSMRAVVEKCYLAGADASMVRAWDFSGAEEVQQRLDALRLQRQQQRVERRERGRHAGRRLQPRFPPQLDFSDDEDADGDESGMDHAHNNMDHSVAVGRTPEGSHCTQASCSSIMDPQRTSGPQGAGSGMGIPCGSRESWTGDGAAAGEQALSRSLPARLGPQRAAWGGAAGPRQNRPLPPPLVRASGCCVEAEAARVSRMTSWDIQRPRRGGGEGVRANG